MAKPVRVIDVIHKRSHTQAREGEGYRQSNPDCRAGYLGKTGGEQPGNAPGHPSSFINLADSEVEGLQGRTCHLRKGSWDIVFS